MPSWKKVIVSGSNAVLNTVTASFLGNLTGTSSFATTASFANLAACSNDIKVTNWDQPDPGQTFYYTEVLSLSTACQDLTTLDTFGLQYRSTPNTHYLGTNFVVTGSIQAGSSVSAGNENTLILGPPPAGGSGEGGQLLLAAPGGTYTSASMWDNWQNYTRLLRGTNAGSDAVVAQWNMHSKQMTLPQYNTTSAFPGTVVGLLAFDSSGNILTTTTGSGGGSLSGGATNYLARWASATTLTTGSVYDTGTSVGVGTTSPAYKLDVSGDIRSTGAIYANANGALYFQGGDDVALYDINLANHLGVYGAQDSTIATIKLGSGGGTVSGRGGNIGINTLSPTSASLTVNGNVWANSFTGSLFGTASFAVTAATASTADNFYVRGNIGISTTSPYSRLTTYGALSTGTAQLSIVNSEGGHAIIRAGLTGLSNNGISFITADVAGTNQNIRMVISAGGLVGINTTSPAERLHVSGNIYLGTGNQSIRYRTATNWDYYLNANNDDFRIYDSDTTYFLQAVYNGGTTNKYLSLLDTLTVRNNGNVGIGTVNPGYKLQVINTSGVASSFLAGAGGYSAIRFASVGTVTGSLTTFNGSVLIGHENAGGTGTEGQIEIASNNDIILGYGLGSFTGNVGIGTSTPTLARLQILGNVSASAYTGSLFGTASFAVTASYSNRAKLADSASYALVTYEDQPAQGSQYWPTIATTYGTQYTGLLSDSRLTYFTDNGTLYSPSFSGSFTGSVTNATSASFAPNFANTNLSLNNDRTHNLNGNNLTFTATSDESIVFNHSSGGTFEINGSPTIYTTGQLLHSVSSATGNIGIGTQTTTARLHVSGTTGVLLRAQNGSTSVLIVSSSGNVGIGTTNPQTTFVVNGSTWINQTSDYFGGGTTVQVSAGGTGAVGIQANTFYLYPYSGNTPSSLIYGYNGNAAWGLINTGGRAKFDFYNYGSSATVMTLTSGSNVGIGNTTPALRLDIVDNGAKTAGIDEALIRIRSTDQYGASIHMSGSSNWRIISTGGGSTPGGGDLGFYSDNGSSYRMVIQGSDGNVGIGTTAPSAELEVIAGATVSTKFNNNQTTFVSEFGSTGNSQYADILLRTNAGTGEIFKAGTGYTSYGGPKALNIYNEQAGIHFFPEGTGTAVMSITGSNVGIGTTNPGVTFEVRRTNVIARLTSTATTNYTELHYQEGGTLKANIWSNGTAQSDYAGASSFNIANLQNAPMAFYTNGYANERMRITADGNVGIGTTTPTHMLEVTTNKTGNGAGSTVRLNRPNNSSYENAINWATGGTNYWFLGSDNDLTDNFYLYNWRRGAFEMTVLSGSGNIGFGTTNPVEKLQVVGNINVTSGEYRLFNNTTVLSAASTALLSINAGGFTSVNIANGNVGIGSTAPTQKLDVNGAIRATLSAVNQANLVMYNSSTGLLTYLATSSFSVVSSSYAVSSSFSTFAATANYATTAGSAGTATNADNAYVATTTDNQNFSLVLALPGHDEYEQLKADSANSSYNPSTGTLTAVRLVETSALKYKDNIESLGSTLDQVLKLRGVSFTKKNTGEQQIGFIADEIEKEFPQIVTKDNQGEIHGLSYQRMTAVLLESVKDLNSKIEAQNLFIKDLLDRIEKLENK